MDFFSVQKIRKFTEKNVNLKHAGDTSKLEYKFYAHTASLP